MEQFEHLKNAKYSSPLNTPPWLLLLLSLNFSDPYFCTSFASCISFSTISVTVEKEKGKKSKERNKRDCIPCVFEFSNWRSNSLLVLYLSHLSFLKLRCFLIISSKPRRVSSTWNLKEHCLEKIEPLRLKITPLNDGVEIFCRRD